MTTRLPQITISIARGTDKGQVSSDLSSLSIGLGLFLGWLFLVLLSSGAADAFRDEASLLFPIAPEAVRPFTATALGACIVALIACSITNQRWLRFYVSRKAPLTATALAVLATGLLCLPVPPSAALPMALIEGVATGAAAGLGIVLWGTAFARCSFTTIVLNTVIGIVLALAMTLALVHWVPSPFAGLVTMLLPLLAFHLLWRLMPAPYFTRQEQPAFNPLQGRPVAFGLRLGLPALVFGVPFGSLQAVCLGAVVPSESIAMQLAVFVASVMAVLLIVAIVMLSKSVSHWDIVFRCIMPVIAVGLAALPFLGGSNGVFGAFLAVCGFVCFEALMWILFSDLSHQFSLSPIYVFGLGNGCMLAGVMVADLATVPLFGNPLTGATSSAYALVLLLALVVGYAFLPRQREVAVLVRSSQRAAAAEAPAEPVKVDDRYAAALGDVQALIDAAYGLAPSQSAPAEEPVEEASPSRGRFQARCDDLSQRYLLSRREREVLRLLAKGHNAAFIQTKLCISKSTAKTHINHIYKKMDIHTQQELLAMVEVKDAADPAADSAPKEGNEDARRRGRPSIFPAT